MIEVHTRLLETQQQKSSVFAAETARENRWAEQETQMHRPVTPPSSQEERKERHTGEQPREGWAKQKAAWRPEDERLFNVIFDGETEEQRNAHNEGIKAEREKEQQKKEKFHEEMLRQYEKHHARLAAISPPDTFVSSFGMDI